MTESKGTPNHAKIWGTALLGAWVARFIFSFIFFKVVPYEVIESIIGYWTVIHWLLLFGFMGAIGAVLMAKGIFHEGGTATGASAAVSSGGVVLTGDGAGTDGVFPVEMALKRRHCVGDLYINPERLMFVCFRDQSIFVANAGNAGSTQFGLLGALIGAILGSIGSGKRAEALEAGRAAAAAVPEDQRASLSEFSWTLRPNEAEEIKSSIWKGSFIKAGGIKYLFHQAIIPDGAKAALKDWASANGVTADL